MDTAIWKVAALGIMLLIMGGVMYLLYQNGRMVLNAKSAATYVGSKRGTAASFTRCSGQIRRIVRFREDRAYTFTLDSALTKGDMSVSILAPDKTVVLSLNSDQPCMAAEFESKKRYTLVLQFRGATGKYALHWD